MHGAKLTRYDQGYATGWHDIHLSTRMRRKRARSRWSEYATGYKHGRVDGASHPDCPEWDDSHRVGGALSGHCPWNPKTAKATPDWEPFQGDTATESGIRRREAALAPALSDRGRDSERG